ncbi:carbohydrate-binding protein [Roseovarius indicus]|uniref:carbohydrate-binding protein n=1 Tax=Roseovarius indicus TaxID=540747 RepID=UPI004058D1E0
MAFYTAFVEEGEAFDPGIHSREDLTVFHARKRQEEGDVAEYDLEVLNTRSAWPGRRILISEDGTLLFAGYLISNLGQVGETVTVQAVAKPADAAARQDALCQSLKDGRHYDPLALPEELRDNISEVLAAHSKVLDWDPVTGEVAAVDLFYGAGEVVIEDAYEDSVAVMFTEPPASVRVTATARWSQAVLQEHDLSHHTDGLRTMTPEDLVGSWPRAGEELSPGLVVTESLAQETVDALGNPEREEITATFQKTEEDFHLDPELDEAPEIAETAFVSTLETRLVAEHSYEVRRTEKTTMELARPLQEGLVLGAPEDIEITLQELRPEDGPLIPDWAPLTSYASGDFVEFNGRVWKSLFNHTSGSTFKDNRWMKSGLPAWMSVRRLRSFWMNDRGQAFAEYMLERAKARLRHTGRCVRVSCDAPTPADASTIRTDAVAEIHAPGLVGGVARGKIVDYVLEWGEGGRTMSVTIATAPGSGEIDSLTISEPAAQIPGEFGSVQVEVENQAETQIVEFTEPRPIEAAAIANAEDVAPGRFTTAIEEQGEEAGRISPTKVTFTPVTPKIDLAGSASFTIEGEFGLPNGYTVQ